MVTYDRSFFVRLSTWLLAMSILLFFFISNALKMRFDDGYMFLFDCCTALGEMQIPAVQRQHA